MKSDEKIYCQLGTDKNDNVIEVETEDDECLITKETCEILLDKETTLLKENPTYLKQCK